MLPDRIVGKWTLICLLLFMHSQALAKKSKSKKNSEDVGQEKTEATGPEKEDLTYLYEVTVDQSIESGTIYKIYKKKLIFKTDTFSEKIRRYSVFLVLNEDKSGVLAEIVVSKVRKKKKKAYARVTRQAEKLEWNDFLNKPVIRLQDLKKVMGNSRIFVENPMFSVLFHQTSLVMSSVNLLTESSISPVVSSTGGSMDLYYPYSEKAGWLNWFGVSIYTDQITKAETIVRLPGSEGTDKAEVSGQQHDYGLVFQPVFREFWLRSLFLKAGLSSGIENIVEVKPETTGDLIFNFDAKFSGIEAGFTVNPVFNIYGGLSYSQSLSGTFTLLQDDSEYLEGKYAFNRVSMWAQILQPLLPSLRADARVRFDRQFDELTAESDSGSETVQKISDWRFSIIAGIAWSL